MRNGGLHLFGRFEAVDPDGPVRGFEGRKVQELFAYLVLQNNKSVQRERLADQLWSDLEPNRSKKYLRQSLWQLQKALTTFHVPRHGRLLTVDQEWIWVDRSAGLHVDVFEFDRAYAAALKVPPGRLEPSVRRELEAAVELYRGDLLDGWYCDWVGYHQDLYRSMYLLILDKLMHDAEETGRWELGLLYGQKVLEVDRANERAHVRMMRLHCLGGDRTSALRQFRTCAQALQDELGVDPEDGTRALYQRIRTDGHGSVISLPVRHRADDRTGGAEALPLGRLRTLKGLLHEVTGHLHALEQEQGDGIRQFPPSSA